MKVIEKTFTPEFRNRLDAIVQFDALSEDIIIHVVDKFIFQLEAQLHDKNVTLTLEPEARAWLAKKGYDPKMGARPMARTVQEHIKKPLANELLFGKLVNGGSVKVYVKDNKIDFIITETSRDLVEHKE
jgi:ATP-dependent Clp protease ATP-binding subunit ClpA